MTHNGIGNKDILYVGKNFFRKTSSLKNQENDLSDGNRENKFDAFHAYCFLPPPTLTHLMGPPHPAPLIPHSQLNSIPTYLTFILIVFV